MPGFKPEVKVSGRWERNSLVFATREEAELSAKNLMWKRTVVEDWRAVEVDEAPNYTLSADGVLRAVKNKEHADE